MRDPTAFIDVMADGFESPDLFNDSSLPVTRESQKEWNYCGPASCQMVAQAFGMTAEQDAIWNALRPLMVAPAQWYTDPRAISSYLAPITAGRESFSDIRCADNITALKRFVYAIVHLGTPPIILVNSGGHWVVVVGVRIIFHDKERLHARIAGLFVADPSPAIKSVEFRPLGNDFLNLAFTKCAVAGQWENSYVFWGAQDDRLTMTALDIDVKQRPTGGAGHLEDSTISDFILEDLRFYGAATASVPLAGGAASTFHVNVGGPDEYHIKLLVRDGNPIWTIFSIQGLELTSVTSEGFVAPPNDQLVKDMVKKAYGYTNVSVRNGLHWKPCLQLRSKYEVFRTVDSDAGEIYVTNLGRMFDTLSLVPDANWLAG